MGRTLLVSGLTLFLFAAPVWAADPVSTPAGDSTSASTAATPLLEASVAAAVSGTSVAVPRAATTTATAVTPDWWLARRGQRPGLLPAMYVGSALLQAFDAYSTLKAVKLGGVEANPVMQGAASSPAAMIGVKATVTTAAILASERLWKGRHRAAAVLTMVASNGFMAWVAMHNASVISGLQH